MKNLSQKETSLLKDQLTHEKVCIEKYRDYAATTQDQQLKQLFQNLAQQEQQHYNTITQILNGQVPSTNTNQAGQNQQQMSPQNQQGGGQTQNYAGSPSTGMQNAAGTNNASLCNDMLMTEKYVSGAYNTAIFEFTDANVRQALNHIQKEEQQHGEAIFNYMQNKGMYNVQG
ncbi:MAG: spore coat protein [Bacillota bacterium]